MTRVGSQHHRKKTLQNRFFLELLTVTHLVKIFSACLKEIPQVFLKNRTGIHSISYLIVHMCM